MRKPLLLASAALLLIGTAGRAAEPDEKLIADLVKLLNDRKNKPEVRSTAIRALGALGWSGLPALDDLLRILDDPEERRLARESLGPWDTIGPWYYAIEAIGQMGPGAKRAVPSLVKAKGVIPPFDPAIDDALRSLLQHPDVTGLLGGLRNADPAVRLYSARTLRTTSGDYAAVHAALTQAANSDPDLDVRRVASEAADQVAKTEATRLARLLKDNDENVRLLAAKALGKMGPLAADAMPALNEIIAKDPDADVRAVARSARKKITGKD
jgi:HEAT repeat protein